MNINEINNKIASEDYSFLVTNPHLGENIILLGLGGSYAYGTAVQNKSDLDVRGVALNTKREILTKENFEQVEHKDTDTVIYSFNKVVHLLEGCNPNLVELLGLLPEHYLYIAPIGQELLDNKDLFLSKKAVFTFGGYANAQLRKLDNRSNRLLSQEQREQHILNSIKNASVDFENRYFEYPEDSIKLYLDDAIDENFVKEIFMDVNLTHYPLRDYKSMWSQMQQIVKDYAKIGQRNSQAVTYGKLSKHMCHLVRLFYMCFDILERGEIVTYRENEHDLLMDIRDGKYLDDNKQPIPEFFEMVDELEKRMNYAKENSCLPEKPNSNAIKEFVMSVNERVVRGEV